MNQATLNDPGLLAGVRASAVTALFGLLWQDYCQHVPDAGRIEEALRRRGERWTEDHVAFRTLPGTPCDSRALGLFFESLGYTRQDHYRFHEKKLNAFWMAPPVSSRTQAWDAPPKVFISELDVASFAPEHRALLEKAIDSVQPGLRPPPVGFVSSTGGATDSGPRLECLQTAFTFTAPSTPLTRSVYDEIRSFSEYAAWTLVYGVCINHFTVSVHLMDGFENLAALNSYLKQTLNVPLNVTGGSEIKGSAAVDLEQSATLAAPMAVRFADGVHTIPYAFVEFAYRFRVPRDADARLWSSYFQGFVEGNADRIFSSTDVQA